MEPKLIIAGLGTVGAAAGIIALASLPFVETDRPHLASVDDVYQLCLKTDAPFFQGVSARCYHRFEIMEFAEAPVTDNAGETVSVALSHPTDFSAEKTITRTCGGYFDLKAEGWYALTSRDQRREAYFIRACGMLAMMLEAREPETVHFTDKSISAQDMASFLDGAPFGIEPAPESESGQRQTKQATLEFQDKNQAAADAIATVRDNDEGALGDVEKEKDLSIAQEQDGQWSVIRGDQSVFIQELALADFDDDGVAEMLVFVRAGQGEGTAAYYAAGLIEKDSPDAQLSFHPSAFSS